MRSLFCTFFFLQKNESKEKSVISTSVRSPGDGSDSDDTSSDGDSLPLSKLIHHSPAPGLLHNLFCHRDMGYTER